MQKVTFGKTQSGQYGLFTNGILAFGFQTVNGRIIHSKYSNTFWNIMGYKQKKEWCASIGFDYIEER